MKTPAPFSIDRKKSLQQYRDYHRERNDNPQEDYDIAESDTAPVRVSHFH